MELIQILKILKKRMRLILLCVLVSSLTTALFSFYYVKPVFEASTKLIVNKSSDNPAVQGQLTWDNVNVNIKLIDTYKEIIKTPAIMNKVVEKYPDLNMTAEQVIRKVKVNAVNNTQVMTVEVRDQSYEKAANIANAVSTVFQEEIPNIMKVDNVAILNEAISKDSPAPVQPNPILNIAISFLVSLMAAVGISLLLEYLDDTVKTEEDVAEILGLPTLAAILQIKDADLSHQSAATSKSKLRGEAPYAAANR